MSDADDTLSMMIAGWEIAVDGVTPCGLPKLLRTEDGRVFRLFYSSVLSQGRLYPPDGDEPQCTDDWKTDGWPYAIVAQDDRQPTEDEWRQIMAAVDAAKAKAKDAAGTPT